jgi:membrane protein
MLWVWLSVMILLLGAELNSEIEHQTACDTTAGDSRPLGERGAVMADNVGRAFTISPREAARLSGAFLSRLLEDLTEGVRRLFRL